MALYCVQVSFSPIGEKGSNDEYGIIEPFRNIHVSSGRIFNRDSHCNQRYRESDIKTATKELGISTTTDGAGVITSCYISQDRLLFLLDRLRVLTINRRIGR